MKKSLRVLACLLFFANSLLYGDAIEIHDNAVADGTIVVDANRDDWAGIPSYEIDDDFDDFEPVDIDRVQVAHDSQNVYIRLQTLAWDVDEAWRVGTYIDTDDDFETGYNGNFLAVSADFLLEDSLYEFTGGATVEWSWANVASLDRNQDVQTDVEVAISREDLGDVESFNFVLFANNFCCDFQLPDDVYPNGGAALGGDFFGYEFGDVVLRGDFDANGELELSDLNRITDAIAAGQGARELDLDGDGSITQSDLTIWVKDLKRTYIGDSNLDGEFNSRDFVQIFTPAKFEQDLPADWGEGDWNADQRFDSGDFVVAFADGGFELGPRNASQNVPEPRTPCLLLLSLFLMHLYRPTKWTSPIEEMEGPTFP